MKRNFPIAIALSAAIALGCASAANAQQAAQPAPVDPSFSAYSLEQQCAQKSDNAAQGQCVGAVRGIVHGYQYGVLFLAQRSSL
jgi:hypothetical protein